MLGMIRLAGLVLLATILFGTQPLLAQGVSLSESEVNDLLEIRQLMESKGLSVDDVRDLINRSQTTRTPTLSDANTLGSSVFDDESLLAYFPFDENAHDATGNSLPIEDAAANIEAAGRFGGAAKVDGRNPLEIPIDLSADVQSEFSVSFWFKMDPLPSDPEAMKKLPSAMTVASDLLMIYGAKTATPSLYLDVPGARGSASNVTFQRDQWTHVLITRKFTEVSGQAGAEGYTALASELMSGERSRQYLARYGAARHHPSIYLGSDSAAGGRAFTGLIDDLKIYDTALSADSIAKLQSPTVTSVATATPGNSLPSVGPFVPGNPAVTSDNETTTANVDTDPGAEPTPKATSNVDWGLSALRLSDNSQAENLYSGKTVRLVAEVNREDELNLQPSALLTVTATNPQDPGWSSVQTIYAQQPSAAGASRNYPIAIELPSATRAGRALGQSNIILTAQLDFPEGSTTSDLQPGNNTIQSSFVVNKPAEKTEHPLEDFRIDLSNPVTTEVSGTPATNNTDIYIPRPDRRFPLRSMAFWENVDSQKVCGTFLTFGVGESKALISRIHDRCGRSSEIVLSVETNGSQHIMTGLGICQATSDRELLGVRVEYRRLLSDGSLGFDTEYVESDEAGLCNNWVDFVRCPANKAAGGLAVSYDSGGGGSRREFDRKRMEYVSEYSDFIKGLALVCGDLVPKNGV